MKHLKQKLLLTALLLLAVISSHADTFTVDGIRYTTYSGTTYYVEQNFSSNISGRITIPEKVLYNDIEYTVTSLGEWAFYGCGELTSITIPSSVTSIGESAFRNCSKLTTANIPNSITSIGKSTFSGCYKLANFTIPNNLTSISDDLFYNCSLITSLAIPNSVTSIGKGAFSRSGLKNMTIPANVSSIGESAFKDCQYLTSIIISNGVTSIGNSAFDSSGLTSVTIPSSISSIGERAFYNCSSLTKAEFESIEGLCGINFGNITSNPIYSAKHLYIDGTEVTELKIPNTVESIGNYAFAGCRGITSATIPNSVTSIGTGVFQDCNYLTSVTFSNNLTRISNSAFSGCSHLSDLTIPSSVTSIGQYAFERCSSLTSVVIPNSVTSIGEGAFRYISNLSSVTFGNSLTNIGMIAFDECRGLTSIVIPSSVENIANYAFRDCTGLKSVTIGNGIKTIGNSVFGNCQKLTSVTVRCTTPPSNSNIFSSTPIQSATLYVPEGSIVAYQSTSPWSGFGQILPYQATKIELTDATPVSYITDNYYDELDYTRTFNNTNWQALYVPFSMDYEDWAEDFEVARLNNVNQYDDDNDGTVDRTVLEVIKLAEGSKTEANTPYMIKAKETGEKTITVADATLYKTEETSHDVTSWEAKFTFTGTYHTVTDMATNGYYALAGGRLQQATSDAVTLSPMRWYLSVTDRNGNPQDLAKVISVVFDDGEATGISEVNTTTRSNAIYSINGSFAGTDRSKLTKGIYVSGGKKIIIK